MPAKLVSEEGDTATVAVPRDAVRRAGLHAGDELDAFAPGGPVLVLTPVAGVPYFAGSLRSISASELSSFLCASVRTGTLVIEDGTARKSVSFREGQVCHASSTDPGDRLGPVLWRNRMVDLAKLRELEPLVKPGLRLGKLLTDRGLLTPAELYRGMQLQVREIVLGIFTHRDGNFAFVEGTVDEAVIKIPERVRDLVLAGIARADELDRLTHRYPPGAVFAPSGTKPATDSHGQALLALFDGKRTLRDVLAASRLGWYAGLKALSEIDKAGAVRRASTAEQARGQVPPSRALGEKEEGRRGVGPVEIYEEVFRRLGAASRSAGRPTSALNSFFDQLPRELADLFKGVRFDDQGGIDVGRVMSNGAALHPEVLGRAKVLDALDTLVMFALFELRNALPGDAGHRLAREIDELQRGVAK